MKKHSITIRIDEHLKNHLDLTLQRTSHLAMSQVIRLLLYSSLDNWKNLDDKQMLEEMRRITSDQWKRLYDHNE